MWNGWRFGLAMRAGARTSASTPSQYTFHIGGQSLAYHIVSTGTPNVGITFATLLRTALGLPTPRGFTKWGSGTATTVSDGTTSNSTDFTTQLRNVAGTGSCILDVADTAQISGGTSSTGAPNYWWNTQDNHVATGDATDLTNTPGPLWKAAVADIIANKSAGLIWAQGEADEGYIGSDGTKRALYKSTLEALFAALRTANGGTLPIFIHRIGRHEASSDFNGPGYQNVRDIQFEVTQDMSAAYITANEYNVRLSADATIAACTTDGTTGVILTANTAGTVVGDRIQGAGVIADGSFVTAINAGVSITVSKATLSPGTFTLLHGDPVHPYPSSIDPLDTAGNTTHDTTVGTYDICRRSVRGILAALTGTPTKTYGPVISAVSPITVGDTQINLTITHDQGTTLTTLNGAISSACAGQFYVENNGNQIVPTNVQLTTGTNIRLTFAAGIDPGTVSVWYAHGIMRSTNYKDFIIDNASPYPTPLQPISPANNAAMTVTVTNSATSYVNSVQNVSITIASGQTSATATITTVGSLAFLVYQGQTCTDSSTSLFNDELAKVTLTNTTTVTATRTSAGTSQAVTINCAVVDPTSSLVDTVQFGTVDITTNATATATITSVDTTRSAVFFLGQTSNNTTAVRTMGGVSLTGATTVTGTIGATNGSSHTIIGFCVVQFKAAAIKSLQQWTTTSTTSGTSEALTISAVDIFNTMLAHGGEWSTTSTFSIRRAYQQVSAPTTVNSVRAASNTTSHTPLFTVIEFVPGVIDNMQRGAISVASATSNTATITAIGSKSLVNFTGASASGTAPNEVLASIAVTNSTTLTAAKNTAGSTTSVVGYEAIDFN